jgi:hypothetical protein
MTPEDKAREVALRRRAKRAGLVLYRSAARRTDDPTRGLYQLGELSTRGRVHPITGWTDLDGIDQELRRS